ncbi:type I phosphomannose isomerase catalytic subunit [Xylanibacter muris]|uniref:Phosphohexomutase n=1 Tax=Xylanibacter muris TaxID=2736290 RepID=A0ABX2AK50_9BACT|nr:type I phosphomannose isomerase catalytic subunit [Xylanibacter muris]NPD91561.1 class I mannose-6-phosphate isomerase [Xylanibacter muris]
MHVIKFEPLLKQTIWGGNRIKEIKHITYDIDNVGESWEISGVKDNESVVHDGEYKGRKLNELVSELKGELIGKDNYECFGNEFPLLIKFIDARKDLSIQVHPDDETARKHGKEHGKTEMWYILKSTVNAKLRSGLSHGITPELYRKHVKDNSICDVISEYDVAEGDCFFIPAGRIHSIGAGCFLLEIQQTSDITYRIYDFNRKDSNGCLRQLHTAEAAECIDYNVESDYRTHYKAKENEGVTLISCKHFTTSVYDMKEAMTLDYSELDSFVILICINGDGTITDEKGNVYTFNEGETVLLPAWDNTVHISGNVKFIETYV